MYAKSGQAPRARSRHGRALSSRRATLIRHARSAPLATYRRQVYDAGVIKTVVLSRRAKKDLETVPAHVRVKLLAWVDSVQEEGMAVVRRVPGFHDEPLKGPRAGQRSIRLSKAYRAIYVETVDGDVELARVEEVNKHDY